MESSHVITSMLIILCILAALDLWRQMAIKNEVLLEHEYQNGVTLNPNFWNYGYRIEDLEVKIDSQKERFDSILENIEINLAPKFVLGRTSLRNTLRNIEYTRKSRIILHTLEQNDTEIFQIRCEKDGPQLRVGLNDYRTDSRDECQLFASPKVEEHVGPQHMFDMIHLEAGSFALRYVGNGMYVKAVPPPQDNERLPWKLVVGGPSIGASETFRLTSEGYLYSALMGGFFSCGSGQMVSGYGDSYYYRPNGNHFVLEPISNDLVMTSYALVDLSKKISRIQSNYALSHEKSLQYAPKPSPVNDSATSLYLSDVDTAIKIALTIPITSKGTDMKDVLDSPFWNNLFDSFMKSIDWRSNRYEFRFYIGFDRADEKYDTGDSWNEFREEFKHRATFRMSEQMMNEEAINKVLDSQLSLKLMHFDHLESAPSQIVSQLVVTAYAEKFDYFYQINDDTILETPNWAPKLISMLKKNPLIPNFGVTGPVDENNEKIFTHSFVHRTHVDVFGYLFPAAFKNWWSDDWITTVYGVKHTFRCTDVMIKHNIHGQKTNNINRYQVDKAAQFVLEDELRFGHAKIDQWLKKKSLPRLPLPEVCGYIPTVRYIASRVIDNSLGKDIKQSL